MDKPLVSVIIPFYNCEKYLDSCIKSLRAQTFGAYEILFIDDGSTDGSADIVRAYSATDSRVLLISQANAGVSAARNNGLALARGDYVLFVDADDHLHPQLMEKCYACASANDADMVCCDYVLTDSTDENYTTYSDIVFEPVSRDDLFYTGDNVGRACWAKLIKRGIAATRSFPVGEIIAEDLYYSILCFLASEKIYFTKEKLYFWYRRPSSSSRVSYQAKHFDSELRCMEMSYEKAHAAGESGIADYVVGAIFKITFAALLLNHFSDEHDAMKVKADAIRKKYLRLMLKAGRIPPRDKLAFLLFMLYPALYRRYRVKTDPTMADYLAAQKAAAQ